MNNIEYIDVYLKCIEDNQIKFDIKNIFIIGCRDLYEVNYFKQKLPNSLIFAFEPNKNQYEECVNNCKYKDVYFFNYALGNENKISDFYITTGNVGASSVLKPSFVPHTNDNKIIKTQIYIKKASTQFNFNPDIIWMDVQGYELEVLKGFDNNIKNVKSIFTEVGLKPYYENHGLKSSIEEYLINNDFLNFGEFPEWEYESNIIFLNKRYLK